jgi:hypothetical protein
MKSPIAQAGVLSKATHRPVQSALSSAFMAKNVYKITGNAPDYAIGAFIGCHGQKRIKNNSDLGWGLI